jgi:hypothetical protein
MLRREKEKSKPQLAQANQPFTPMSHKGKKGDGTPYQPLRVDDLATPKMNKSHSASGQDCSQIDDIEIDDSDDMIHQIRSIRKATASIQIALDNLERKCEHRRVQKRTCSIATQTGDFGVVEAKKPTKSADLTEVSLSDHSNTTDTSPVHKLSSKRIEKPKSRPIPRHEESDPREKLRLSPMTKGKPSFDTPDASDRAKARGGSISSSPVSGDDLQKRLHDMSILLKRLEYQLDDLNQT